MLKLVSIIRFVLILTNNINRNHLQVQNPGRLKIRSEYLVLAGNDVRLRSCTGFLILLDHFCREVIEDPYLFFAALRRK
jgi:hypothetical protein